MKFIFKTILIAALATLLQTFFPWWSMAIAAFTISCFIYTKGFNSFFAGFISISLLWSIKAYYIDLANEQILSNKIASLFTTSPSFTITPLLLVIITGVIGGLVAGF
ncbi:MAG: hypothetical protein OEW67_15300, partial [Cyclobacteriaceae bacterium]|nr:hypothetical protein [Cyclobacteriaceae bacterium]